jgi:hypothetical protein
MVRFLNIRGKWLQTPDSVAPYKVFIYIVVPSLAAAASIK